MWDTERERERKEREKETEECLANDHLPFKMRWERQDVTCQSCLLLRKLVSSSLAHRVPNFKYDGKYGIFKYDGKYGIWDSCSPFKTVVQYLCKSKSSSSSLCHSFSSFSFLLSSLLLPLLLLFLIDTVMTYTRVTLTKKARFACSGNICNVLSTSIYVQKGKSCIKVKSK